MRPLEDRFDEKFIAVGSGGCWLWTGCIDNKGYGMIGVGRRIDGMVRSHRVAYELHNGAIPKGKGHNGTCVCHKCDNPLCVNPAHLFIGSNFDNVADRVAKGRSSSGETHCCAKLTDAQVAQIRSLAGTMLHREIAALFGVGRSHVGGIIRREWRRV